MHSELSQRGLSILAFPCNQFGAQEPQDASKIETCVRRKFAVGFPLLEKVHVNGEGTHDVFRWLRLKGSEDAAAIPWNFNLFLVGRDGETCTRFSNTRTPSSIRADVEAALDAPAPSADGLVVAPPDVPSKQEAIEALAAESPSSVLAAM